MFDNEKRFAGNPLLGLTDELRVMFSIAHRGFGNDADKTRAALSDRAKGSAGIVIELFDQFLREEDSAAKAKNKSGLESEKVKIRNAHINAKAEKADRERDTSASPEDHIGKDWRYVDGLKSKMLASEEAAKSTSDNERALAALGEFARTWFRLYAIEKEDSEINSAYSLLQKHLSEVRPGDEFDERNVRDEILGRGVFAPKDGGADNGQTSDGYSYLTADERKILDASLMTYLEDMSTRRACLSGKSLRYVWTRMASSLVHELLYDKYAERLLVCLDRGRYYEYAKVPGYVVFGLIRAESAGKFFGTEISGGGYEYSELKRDAFDEIKSQAVENGYLRLNDYLEKGLDSVLRREDYDFKASRNMLRRIYGHVFDCAMCSYEAILMYAKISVPMAKVMRWQALEMKEMHRTIELLERQHARLSMKRFHNRVEG